MNLIVNCEQRTLSFGGLTYPCRIGREGFICGDQGCEGDEKTPLGTYRLRFGFYRADRLAKPQSLLTFHALDPTDGWCDAADDPAYNRYVRLPYAASHEKLWREDGAYDVILVMNHNDSPPVPGLGSAVFIHITQPDDRSTLGCIALEPEVMVRLLPHLSHQTEIEIRR